MSISSGIPASPQDHQEHQRGEPWSLSLGKHKALSTFPPPRRRAVNLNSNSLLRREEDETTVQRRVGKPAHSNASPGTEAFYRTDTCGSSSRARRVISTKRPNTFTRTALSPTSNLLQFGGGPYDITPINVQPTLMVVRVGLHEPCYS